MVAETFALRFVPKFRLLRRTSIIFLLLIALVSLAGSLSSGGAVAGTIPAATYRGTIGMFSVTKVGIDKEGSISYDYVLSSPALIRSSTSRACT